VELEGQTFKSIIMMCLDLPYKEHMLCASRVDLLGGIIPNYTTFFQTFHSSHNLSSFFLKAIWNAIPNSLERRSNFMQLK